MKKTMYILSGAQFDEDGQGMWLFSPIAYTNKAEAVKGLKAEVDDKVQYFSENGDEADVDVRLRPTSADIFYNSISVSLRIDQVPIK